MAPGSTFGVMAALLAEALITLGAALQGWCQWEKAGVPLTDVIKLQPSVVPVAGIGVIKSLTDPWWCGVSVSPAGSR